MPLFDLDTILQRMLQRHLWKNDRERLLLEKWEYMKLAEMVTDDFRTSPPLVSVQAPARVVGDLHGQYGDLLCMLTRTGLSEDGMPPFLACRWVFLGDYVDRGRFGIETITLLFLLRIRFPKSFVLLRGNHECRSVNQVYGFMEEVINKLQNRMEDPMAVYEQFNKAFSWMPLAAVLSETILCMHGGISPHLKSLHDIKTIPQPLIAPPPNSLALDLLWADPGDTGTDDSGFMKNRERGQSVVFDKSAIFESCQKLGIKMIIRAHQMFAKGFDVFSAHLITVFTAPTYMGHRNDGAFLDVRENGVIKIVQISHRTKNSNDSRKECVDEPTEKCDSAKIPNTKE